MSRDPDMDLFLAVAADDVAGVEAALRGEGYANEIEAASKMAPMSWAARLGRLDCARAMMAAGGDPWAVATGAEASAMAYARIHGQWELYEAMSKEGDPKLALPGAVEAEWVAAVGASCARALPALAPLGIEVDKAFGNGRQPPLCVAMHAKDEAMARALLALGADPNAVFGRDGSKACAALRAVDFGWARGLEILIDAGADPNGVEPDGLAMQLAGGTRPSAEALTRMLSILEAAGAGLTAPGLGGRLLMQAVLANNLPVAKWLCERGVDPNARLGQGASPLAVAALRPSGPLAAMIGPFALARSEQAAIAQAAAPAVQSALPVRRM